MMLSKISSNQKTGNEHFRFDDKILNNNLLSFWQWGFSDILSNTTRGILAEFIVATSLEIDLNIPREEWDNYDLETSDGVKIEVKSAAFLQSWSQSKLSSISFSIKPSKIYYAETNKREAIAQRSADAYIFCLLNHKDKATVNPINIDQWEFYVLSTPEINKYSLNQKSITLNSLRKITRALKFDEIKNEVQAQVS
jgi:hypothetical protein